MSTLRILVVDDHEVVRKGVCALIEAHPGWAVCAEAVDGNDAVEKARTHSPDVIVLDLTMPRLNGLEALRQLRKVVPKSEVLVLTMHDSEQIAREVLDAGARGYLMKSDAGRELVNAVEAVSNHAPYFTSRMAERMLDVYLEQGATHPKASRGEALTPREWQIVQLLAEGKTNKEVAALLNISVKTAETHRANVMRKLRLRSHAELIHYAIRNRPPLT